MFLDKFQEERGRREGELQLALVLSFSTWEKQLGPSPRRKEVSGDKGHMIPSWPYLIPMWAWISVKVTMLKWRCV